MIDVLYFAWVRERIGLPKERIETGADTVADLVAELSAREVVERGLSIAADICVYTNHNLVIEELDCDA